MTKEKKKEYLIISIIPITFFIYSITLILKNHTLHSFFINLINIFTWNDILLTDYFYLAGKEISIFNASLVCLINIFILYKMDMKINGLNIAAIYQMLGFSFMGKNLMNIIPFYIGGYLYSKVEKRSYKSVVITTMFTTSLSPIVSTTLAHFNFSISGFLISTFLGILLGFIVPPIAAHTLQIHGGYSLYNTGFASGFIAIIFYSVLKLMGIIIIPNRNFIIDMDYWLFTMLLLIFLFFIIYGYIKNNNSFKEYFELLEESGRLVSDFTVTEGFYTVIINMGFLGILTLVLILLFFPIINGPILAGLFSVIGFSGFGKHIKNITPIIIGVILAYFTIGQNTVSLTSFGVTLLFCTSLAPISGKFGIIPGIFAGFLNFSLVYNIGTTHAGLNLYNTGLASGITAGTFVPLLQLYEKNTK